MTNKLAIVFLMSELFSLFPGLFDKLPVEAKDFSDEVEKIIKKHEKGGGYVQLHYIYSLFRTMQGVYFLSFSDSGIEVLNIRLEKSYF